MATLDPLLDLPPTASAAPAHQATPAQGPVAERPSLLIGVLRRWPWLLLGLATGLVLGVLHYMQGTPEYRSTTQLNVVKNRPELVASSTGDARMQYVEDYVGPQVILLKSETILKAAAEKLDQFKPFQNLPPEGVADRVGFLRQRFEVTREKEPGSNAPSNVLLLTFKALDPADAPKYLRAIVAAYRDELSKVSGGASESQIAGLEKKLADLKKDKGNIETQLAEAGRTLRGVIDPDTKQVRTPGISQEELPSIRLRIAANRGSETALKLRLIVVEAELKDIEGAGKTRAQRLAVMAKLNVPVERPGVLGDLRDPEAVLVHLKLKKGELGARLGPGHPDMISLTKQIKAIEDDLEKRGGPVEDELERYRRKLDNDRAAISSQLKVLDEQIAADEDKARRMAPLQAEVERLQADLVATNNRIWEAEREKTAASNNEKVSVFRLTSITDPSTGVQVSPVLYQSLFLGLLVGLLLGGGLALRAELADRSFRSPADVRRSLGLPILGHIPPMRLTDPAEVVSTAKLDPVLAVYLRPRSGEAEAVRGIRTQLLFSTQNRANQVIQVTSPSSGDGKSTLAANLAIALAKSDKRVVLVDCDFRKPRVHKLFDLPNPEVGLASVVADQADLGGAMQSCEIENLSLLPCGPKPANPAELLSGDKFREILDDLRGIYDYVILDTPPVLAVSDPVAVASRADGVIVVFRMTGKAQPTVERTKEELTGVRARLLGVVVNGSTERDMGYGYGYTYRNDYQYGDQK